MAIILPGPLVGAISGTVAGTNFGIGKHGAWVRNSYSRKKGNTEYQLVNRKVMHMATTAWFALSDRKKQSWRSAAAITPFLNRLGISRYLTGFQLFCKYVFENYPYEIDFDIACGFCGKTPTAVLLDQIVSEGPNWRIWMQEPIKYTTAVLKIFCSRPYTRSFRRHYNHWFLIYWGAEEFPWIDIQHPGFRHQKLLTVAYTEVVALKIRRRVFYDGGPIFYSQGSIYADKVAP